MSNIGRRRNAFSRRFDYSEYNFDLERVCEINEHCFHVQLIFQVEAGDVIVKVNGTDVHLLSTKEGT